MNIFDIFSRKSCQGKDDGNQYMNTNELASDKVSLDNECTNEIIDFVAKKEAGIVNYRLEDLDPLFDEVAFFVIRIQQASVSVIQKKFSISYNRACRVLDQLESVGIVRTVLQSMEKNVLINTDSDLKKILYIARHLNDIVDGEFMKIHYRQIEDKKMHYLCLVNNKNNEFAKQIEQKEIEKAKQKLIESNRKKEIKSKAKNNLNYKVK